MGGGVQVSANLHDPEAATKGTSECVPSLFSSVLATSPHNREETAEMCPIFGFVQTKTLISRHDKGV